MKYITRVDRYLHHCWVVALGQGKSWGVVKTFYDKKCGGQYNSLALAIQFRDKQLIKLKKHLPVSKGWSEQWRDRNEWSYLYICATHTKDKVVEKKRWSVSKYGYDKAVQLAEEWRELKLIGE